MRTDIFLLPCLATWLVGIRFDDLVSANVLIKDQAHGDQSHKYGLIMTQPNSWVNATFTNFGPAHFLKRQKKKMYRFSLDITRQRLWLMES